MRDRLIADLARLQSSDEAADWVHKNLPVKNTLAAVDAEFVEASFRERLAAIEVPASASKNWSHATATVGGTAPTEQPPGFDGEPFVASSEDLWADNPGRSAGCASSWRCGENHSPAGQGALQFRRQATLRRLRPDADRSPSHSICSTPRSWPQGQRRIHGPGLPAAPPRSARLRRRSVMVGRVNIDPLPIALDAVDDTHADRGSNPA